MAFLKKLRFLNGNVLKLIALVTMTVDHVGGIIFPHVVWMRIVGRLAFPIFAYMIAEGCLYTRSKARYLTMIAALGILCQCIFWFAEHSMYQCILITFSLSIIMIYLLQNAWKERNSFIHWIIFILALGVVFFVTYIVPAQPWSNGFAVDYGFFGVLLPVFIHIPDLILKDKDTLLDIRFLLKWVMLGLGLILVASTITLRVQWWSLLALIPVLLYSGTRGRVNMKYLFYIYYPLHLGILYLVSTLV